MKASRLHKFKIWGDLKMEMQKFRS